MKKLNAFLFVVICVLFTLVMLGADLFSLIEIASLSHEITEKEAAIRRLSSENKILSAALANRYSIEHIDKYAREKLFMQMPSPEQIYIIEFENQLG